MEFPILLQPFDREDFAAISLHGQNRAGLDCLAVEDDRARTTQARLTANVRTGEAQHVAQIVNQEQARLDFVGVPLTVDGDGNCSLHTALHWYCHTLEPAARSRRYLATLSCRLDAPSHRLPPKRVLSCSLRTASGRQYGQWGG